MQACDLRGYGRGRLLSLKTTTTATATATATTAASPGQDAVERHNQHLCHMIYKSHEVQEVRGL